MNDLVANTLFKRPNSHIMCYTTKNSFKVNTGPNNFPSSSELLTRKIMQNKHFIDNYFNAFIFQLLKLEVLTAITQQAVLKLVKRIRLSVGYVTL